MTRPQKTLLILGILAVVAIALRVASPRIVEEYVNRQLADMGDYRGTVGDVDLALIRGGYTLHDLTVVKVAGDVETPFVDMDQMDLSIQWRALFRGNVVGEVVMERPVVNFVQSESDAESQYGTGVNWPQEIRDLFPFQLNLVRIVDGLVTFRAPGIEAEESLTARDFQLELQNLTNAQELATEAFADVELEARVMGNAPLKLAGQIDPNEEVPTFNIDLSLEGARLVDINPWLVEFLNADAHAGVFSLYSELAAANGGFEGYLRPILENPEFFDPEEESTGPFKKAWEAMVGFAAKIFENRQEDQVATQIPLTGQFENPKAGILPALVNLLRNAFVGAFAHSLEGSISFGDVGEQTSCLKTEGQREAECADAPDQAEPDPESR
jgi:hypothetical protein